jgi:hypothetical protein
MAKWKSPIFSDIRNKLGENVVFSMWKGRQYMRSYTKPSNPKTLAQTANRLHMKAVVSWWQQYVVLTPSAVTAWNAAALSDLISGFNLFVKTIRGVVISAVTLSHATFTLKVDTVTVPANDVLLAVWAATPEVILVASKYGPGTYTAADFTGWTPAAGDQVFVTNNKAAGTGGITNYTYTKFGMPLYNVDEATGELVPVILT